MSRWGHRHPHRHGLHGRSRVPRAIKLGLQRRIFAAFGGTILFTGICIYIVMHLFGGAGWKRDVDRARRFVSRQLAAVWEDPPRRKVLVDSVAGDLDVGITLYDTNDRVVERAGETCDRRPIQVRVMDPKTGTRLGRADVCPTGALAPPTTRILIGICVAVFMIWAASGLVAHKLSKPLVQVAEVAKDIGRGRLQSRSLLDRRHRHDEAGILADALYDAAARIDKQLADQRALLAAVSHEIRTPLARMRLLVELAQSDDKKLSDLDAEIVELDKLVADLLAGARVDFSALKPVAIDLHKLVGDVLARDGMDGSKIDVDGEIGVEGDATLLSRAVTNIVQNAIHHAGGVDRVQLTRTNEHVTIAVLDRGPGLLPGEEAKLFEPFYRRAETEGKAPAMSVGLGLALVRRIAEAHGGTAFAETREGGGARIGFTVRA